MAIPPARPSFSSQSRRDRLARSGWLTPALVAALCAALLLATYEHGRGHYVHLRQAVIPPQPPDLSGAGPGGEAPVVLSRRSSQNASTPEFVSATLLPGRGMNLWQLTAFVPGRGIVSLLASPSLDVAGLLLSGTGDDANGSAAASAGSAFLAPWAGRLGGSAAPVPGTIQTSWHGTPLQVPAQSASLLVSTDGLLLNLAADSISTSAIAGSESVQAVFRARGAAAALPGSTEYTVSAELSATDLDLTLSATNRGAAPEPMGLGWLPHFALPGGSRDGVLLTVSASRRSPAAEHTGGLPTGRMLAVQDTPYDLQHTGGTPLGALSLDDTYLDLNTALFGDGPVAELRLPRSGYGLRISPLSASITNFRVIAPPALPWVSIGPDTNVPDPFGREWKDLPSNGMTVLQPGETMHWRVRLSIFATLDAASSPPRSS